MIQLESRRMGMRPVVVIACRLMAALKGWAASLQKLASARSSNFTVVTTTCASPGALMSVCAALTLRGGNPKGMAAGPVGSPGQPCEMSELRAGRSESRRSEVAIRDSM